MPGPWSSTMRTPSASRKRDGAARTGSTSRRCRAGWSRRARARLASPTSHQGAGRRRRRRRGHDGVRAPRPGRRPRPGRPRTHRAGRLVARELHQVADQRGQLLDLRAHVVEQLGAGLGRQRRVHSAWREQVEVGAQRGERRPQLVAGVGHQPTLPVAGGATRASSIWLNAVASRATSSSPSTRSGARSSVRAIRSTAVVSRRTGRRPLRATTQPARPAVEHAQQPEDEDHQRELRQRAVLGGQRLGQHERLVRLRSARSPRG